MRVRGETIYQKAISNLTRAPAEMRNQRASEEGVVKNGAHNNNRRGEKREAPSPTEAFSSFLSWQYNGRVRDFLIDSGKLLHGRSSVQADALIEYISSINFTHSLQKSHGREII